SAPTEPTRRAAPAAAPADSPTPRTASARPAAACAAPGPREPRARPGPGPWRPAPRAGAGEPGNNASSCSSVPLHRVDPVHPQKLTRTPTLMERGAATMSGRSQMSAVVDVCEKLPPPITSNRPAMPAPPSQSPVVGKTWRQLRRFSRFVTRRNAPYLRFATRQSFRTSRFTSYVAGLVPLFRSALPTPYASTGVYGSPLAARSVMLADVLRSR